MAAKREDQMSTRHVRQAGREAAHWAGQVEDGMETTRRKSKFLMGAHSRRCRCQKPGGDEPAGSHCCQNKPLKPCQPAACTATGKCPGLP